MSLLKVNEVTDLGGDAPTIPAYAGQILQVVSTTKTDTFTSSSTSPVDITGLSVSITPSSTSSKIMVFANVMLNTSAGNSLGVNLLRDSTHISVTTATVTKEVSVAYCPGVNSTVDLNTSQINFLDSPSSVSSLTYKLQAFVSSGSLYVNRWTADTFWGGTSSITVMEVAG